MTKKIYLSASSIADFKACPTRYFLHYVLGIVPAVEKDVFRIGTNYHRLHQILGMEAGGHCECDKNMKLNCPLCNDTRRLPEDLMDAVISELDFCYADDKCPASKELKDWQVEKAILLNTIAGYRWYWQHDQKTIQSEIPFNFSLINPFKGTVETDVVVKGYIDKLISLAGKLAEREYKSTSQPIEPGSDYWKHLNLDTQTLLYIYAGRLLQKQGVAKSLSKQLLNTAYYDVWHKPGISPKKLSQADTKKFFTTKEYFDVEFDIGGQWNQDNHLFININGQPAEMFSGKKEGTWSITETAEMFGARYLADIAERPEYYFACKEIERSDKELEEFEKELYNICTAIKLMKANNCWFRNEHQCEAKFKCPYINICYNGLVSEVAKGEIPPEYKCLWNKEKK